MATQTLSPRTPADHSFKGTTITELEQVVEHAILKTRPLMTVAQIRILLHVFDACENCSGEGTISVRGYDSEFVEQERCPECKGKGFIEGSAVQQ